MPGFLGSDFIASAKPLETAALGQSGLTPPGLKMWVLLDEEDCPAKLYPEIPLTGLTKRGAGILGVKEINNSCLISLTFMQTQLSGSCKAMLFLTTKEPLRDLQT